mmetsp:Transcript_64393/g.178338  ORF Transcript_64393/g.178338 Transcript_64393/m.178338 type:complete len:226 (-) Transcript_64393:1451-2128(-)
MPSLKEAETVGAIAPRYNHECQYQRSLQAVLHRSLLSPALSYNRKRSVAFGRAGSARYGKPPTTSTRPARPNGRRSVPNRHCFGGRRSGRPRSSFTNRRRGNTCASAWKGRPPNKPTRKCTKRSTTDLWKRKRGRSSSNTVSAQWSVGVYARSSDPSFLLHPTLFPTSLHPDPNPDADELKWKIWILTGIFFIAASIGSFQVLACPRPRVRATHCDLRHHILTTP